MDLFQAAHCQVSPSEGGSGQIPWPIRNEGNEMAQWILQQNGKVVPRRTLRRLSREELNPNNMVELAKRQAFDSEIKRHLGDSLAVPPTLEVDDLDPDNENNLEDNLKKNIPTVSSLRLILLTPLEDQ